MLLICHLKTVTIRCVNNYAITWSFSVTIIYQKSKSIRDNSKLLFYSCSFRSILVKTSTCSDRSFWRCSYLPWLWLLFASMVSPDPLQSARPESLLVNKPETTLLPPEIQQVSSPRAHCCFCFQEARHEHRSTTERHMLCLATQEGSEAVNKKQRKDRLYLLDTKWLQHL